MRRPETHSETHEYDRTLWRSSLLERSGGWRSVLVSWTGALGICVAGGAGAQSAPQNSPAPSASPTPPVRAENVPQNPDAPVSSADILTQKGEAAIPKITFEADEDNSISPNGDISGRGNVRATYPGVVITADRISGNLNGDVVFSGNAKLVAKGATTYADTIHFYPAQSAYRLENPRGTLEPSFLKEQTLSNVFVRGGVIEGRKEGYIYATDGDATTCEFPDPHYDLRFRSAELIPERYLILKQVSVSLFGHKLFTLPQMVIPLNRRITRRPRTNYLPEAGRNQQEGYYVRFPYSFPVGKDMASFMRLDLTELRGAGYRFEHEYLAGAQQSAFDTSSQSPENGGFNFTGGGQGTFLNAMGGGGTGRLPRLGTGLGPNSGGLFAMQGYFQDGFAKNFNASYRHQQSIGSNNRIAFSTELQRNSFLTYSEQQSQTTRFGFSHNDFKHGVNAELSLNLSKTSSSSFSNNQLSGTYRHSFDFASQGSTRNNLSFNLDYADTGSSSSNYTNRTARLNSQIQFAHSSREYNLTVATNKSTPIGAQSGTGSFGTLERLPELFLTAETVNFKRGWLRKIPTRLELGYGRYSEPGSNENTDRVLLGFNTQEMQIVRGNTEITAGAGFEQRIYGDGAAQYVLRSSSRLRQHLRGRSGFDLTYQYQRPEGGTPFLFDTFSQMHYLAAEGGYLTDPKFQFTIRAGYDFLGTSAQRPWQSVSARMMWKPSAQTRFDMLGTYDPNSGRFFSVTNSLRLRGRNDFAMDITSRYDPQQGRISQVNSQFDLPLSKQWRFAGLLRYNGFRGQFESMNMQLTRVWDCMEMSLTYTDTPFGFQRNQQIYFSFRITAFPFFRTFGRGPAGDALGTGLGEIY